MTPDIDTYLPMVEDLDMPLEAKREMLTALWTIMEAFVDRAFEVDATSLALGSAKHNAKEAGIDPKNDLDSKFSQHARRQRKTQRKGALHDPQTRRHLLPCIKP